MLALGPRLTAFLQRAVLRVLPKGNTKAAQPQREWRRVQVHPWMGRQPAKVPRRALVLREKKGEERRRRSCGGAPGDAAVFLPLLGALSAPAPLLGRGSDHCPWTSGGPGSRWALSGGKAWRQQRPAGAGPQRHSSSFGRCCHH